MIGGISPVFMLKRKCTMKTSKSPKSIKQKDPTLHGKREPFKKIMHPLTLDCVHAPEDPKYGQEVVYTISFLNPNTTKVSSVKIVYDQSFEGNPDIDLLSATNGGYIKGNKIVWDALGDLVPGQSGFVSFVMRAPVGMDPCGMISCSASVSIQSAQTSPASAWHLTDVIPWEDLNFVVSCPGTVHRGQTFQYVISMINNCEIMVTAIRIDAKLSDDVTFVDASGGGVYVSGWHGITWDPLGSLGPGDSQSITATVTVNSHAPLGTGVICLGFYRFLSDESVGIGQDACISVRLMIVPFSKS
jgi:hypothetical protein